MENETPKPGRGWRGDKEGHARAGRKGGEQVVATHGRHHMASIGRKGGTTVSQDTAHMSRIGQRGGKNSRAAQKARQEAEDEFDNEHSISNRHA